MKNLIKVEEFFFFIASIAALYFLGVEWWYYLLLFLGPDISMIGYAAGNKVGAISYNLFHHKAVAVVIILAAFIFQIELLFIIGIIIFGHSSMDRMFGYGLKYARGFQHTHLGEIKKNKEEKVVSHRDAELAENLP